MPPKPTGIDEGLLHDIRDAIVEELLKSSRPVTLKEMERAALTAVERGGGGVSATKVREATKWVQSHLEDEGDLNPVAGGFEMSPRGRGRWLR
ncbi:MAG TPA: hypothetical protein VM889_10075 [Candidatus Thermoplasmatota archaeon]|nr:hypothetical protein [Candidatus Thermoplasmatota archaeon]